MVKIPDKSYCLLCDRKPALLKLLNEEEFQEIIQNRILIQYRAGETIIKQDSRATQAMAVHSGFVKVFVEGNDGKNLILRYGKTSDFIGISGLYTDLKYTFSVSAIDDCMACFIDYDILEKFIKTKPEFGAEIISILSSEKAYMHSKFLCLTQKQIPGRVANALLYLNNEVFQDTKNNIYATRTEISELTGMSKDSAGRVLKDFTDEGIIVSSGRIISLKNISKLEQIRDLG